MLELHYCILPRKVAKERGIKFYFTGKPCKHGHISERDTKSCECLECKPARILKWRRENENHVIDYGIRYREENSDILAEKSKKYRDENREEINSKNRERWRASGKKNNKDYLSKYYEKNKERLKKASEEYRIKNKDKQDIWRKNWENKNPDLVQSSKRAYKHRRRTIEQEGPSTKEINDWAEGQDKVCAYCGVDCSGGFHLDHYHPLSRGGRHKIDNLRISCASCNLRKGAKMPEAWMAIVEKDKKSVDSDSGEDIDCSDTTLANRS